MEQTTSRIGEWAGGGIAGIIGKVVEFPFEVVKTKQQWLMKKRKNTTSSSTPNGNTVSTSPNNISSSTTMKTSSAATTTTTTSPSTKTPKTATISTKTTATSAPVKKGGVFANNSSLLSFTTEFAYLRDSNMNVNSKTRSTTVSAATSPVRCAKNILQREGVKGFYKGVSMPMLGGALENSIAFSVYESTLRGLKILSPIHIEGKQQQASMTHVLLAGGTAGIATTCVLTPVDLVRNRLLCSSGPYRYQSTWDCVRRTMLKEGGLAFTTGGLATMAREIPGTSSYFFSYEFTMRTFWSQQQQQPWYAVPIAGGISGVVYVVSFYPADVVRTYVQTDKRFRKMRFLEAFKTVYQMNGIRGLYCGVRIAALRALPANASIFTTYEIIKNFN